MDQELKDLLELDFELEGSSSELAQPLSADSVEALVSYIGLAPSERSSGSSIRGRGQIGHSGHARLGPLLYLGTLTAARFNPVIKILELPPGQKRKKNRVK